MKELCEYHVSGQLKVAPEHISDAVLKYMGKPENSVYRRFVQSYQKMNEKIGRKQFLVPYLMSSHPGSTLKEAVELAEFLRDFGYMPEQVQDCLLYTSSQQPDSGRDGYGCRKNGSYHDCPFIHRRCRTGRDVYKRQL